MFSGVLDHEVDGNEAKGAALAAPPVHEHSAVLLAGLLDEAHDGVDDCLVDDVLDGGFSPVEGEEGHALDD